ncbi:hypothetical protein R1flu_021639 [Riccia fluitans]|uniref:Uncharacterized protein n=1 Tax=Riccia fluitans TaxID=41844 RepID=A0ABD1ZRY8_9MARC
MKGPETLQPATAPQRQAKNFLLSWILSLTGLAKLRDSEGLRVGQFNVVIPDRREKRRCLVLAIHLMIDFEVASIVLLQAIRYVFPGMIGFGVGGRSGLGWHPNASVARVELNYNIFLIS